jgi:succinoglycan biosynthesis protein ExoA
MSTVPPPSAGERTVSPGEPGTAPRPRLSVVLPVLNEARDLGTLLDQLCAQDPVPGGVEILVADGGSTDGTRERVRERTRRWPELRLIDNPDRRSSPGRNRGAEAAAGDYVLFLDGHCALPRRDYLVRVLEIFAESGADCLCRPQPLDRLGEEGWEQAIARARHSPLGHKPGSDIYGGAPGFTDPRSAGAAYTRRVIEELGGFDERFDACEDVEFNHRVREAGHRAYLHPDLEVPYRPRATLGGLFRQMMNYGRGRARLFARHRSTAPWSLLALSAAVLALGVGAVALGPGRGPLLLGGAALLWLVLILGEGFRVGSSAGEGIRAAAALAAIHLGLLAGFWRGLPEAPRYRSAPAGATREAAHAR